MNSANQPSVVLTIEKLVHGGYGLARTDSGVVLVDSVIPGEKVLTRLLKKRGGMSYMSIIEIVNPSTYRRVPPCGYFGNCGGCDWQFIDYQMQLFCKKEIFIDVMHRIGKIAEFPTPVIVSSPEFGYRRRVQLKIDAQKSTGFYRRESNEVVRIECCLLCTNGINRILKRCLDTPSVLPNDLRNCKIIDGDDTTASIPVLPSLTHDSTTLRCGGIVFDVQGGDFVQSNRFLLEPLATWVASWCTGETLVDLYGGTGFFAMMLANQFRQGWLIESDKNMADRARINFKKNSIDHMTSICASAENLMDFIPARPDVLVVDPPRPGLTRNACDAILRGHPETIIYVSCNCATQARDAASFIKGGYRIVASALFDLYPNTHHTETILVFTKGN